MSEVCPGTIFYSSAALRGKGSSGSHVRSLDPATERKSWERQISQSRGKERRWHLHESKTVGSRVPVTPAGEDGDILGKRTVLTPKRKGSWGDLPSSRCRAILVVGCHRHGPN